jgi:hypothetical protein
MKPMRSDGHLRIVETARGYVLVQGVAHKVAGPYPSRTTALWALEAKLPKRRRQVRNRDAART